MILPSPDRLNRFNKYALVMLAAKRARQLQEQGIARRALVKSSSSNPLTIALEEIAAGRLVPSFNPEPLPELMEPEAPEAVLTPEEFEEAMAKVVEANLKASDNGHEASEVEPDVVEPEEEANEDLSLSEEEEPSLSEEIDAVLGLDEDEPDTGDLSEEEDVQHTLFGDEDQSAE
ncbi:MAG: DNA-directed RNA polymerase subunit omega [Armatimonadota bacterium]